jgi:adenine-specific DNA glycosylase
LSATAKVVPQKKRDIHYFLGHRDGEVLLVKRPPDASVMPGMWELPELANMNGAEFLVVAPTPLRQPPGTAPPNRGPLFTLRHSITITNYTVCVWRARVPSSLGGRWIPVKRLRNMALTGLAKKILRRAEVL